MSTQKPYRTPRGIEDPTRAKKRLVLAPLSNPSDSIYVLFNPEELRMALDITQGKLAPVGWSHPVKMYGSTDDWQFPIKLYLSQFMIWLDSYEFLSIHAAMGWFSQFGYGDKPGKSPSPMIVVWPGTLTMVVTVSRIEQGITKWDQDLLIRLGEVTLTCGEIRQKFKTRDAAAKGHLNSDEGHSAKGAGAGFRPGMTGQPMNLLASNRGRGRGS